MRPLYSAALASDGVTIVIAVTIAAVIMSLFFINTVPPFLLYIYNFSTYVVILQVIY